MAKSYKLYAAIAAVLLLLILATQGGEDDGDSARRWLEDRGGQVFDIGPWQGNDGELHHECWGSSSGAVACSDGYREVF